MNADIITDTTYPHGTAEGFQGGCNTAHCPAEVSCRTVHTRYVGDWAFRRQINAGKTPAEIIAQEREQAREAAQAALDAQKAEKAARAAETREQARKRRNATRRSTRRTNPGSGVKRGDGTPRTPLQLEIHRLHSEGHTDAEIAHALGKKRNQVKGVRLYLLLKPNPAPATMGASS